MPSEIAVPVATSDLRQSPGLFDRFNTYLKEYVMMLQDFFFFGVRSFRTMTHVKKYWKDVKTQMYATGTESVPIIIVSSIAIGALITLEVGNQLEAFGAKMMTGRATALSVLREMAPMLTGLMLASRVGARNGAELGAMKISEQIDALRAFGTDPIAKLVMPRLVAAIIMFLPLVAVSDLVGLLSGWYVAFYYHHIDTSFYWNSVLLLLVEKDFVVGFIKPPVFAVIITLVSCFNGFSATGGTVGVGRFTIKGIVASCGLVLIANFYLSKLVLENM